MVRRSIPLLLLPSLALACAKATPVLPETARIHHYQVPWENAFPSDVVVDDEGQLWFTDRLTHALAVFDPETESFERYPTPTASSAPYGLVRAPDGVLWFGESNAGRLGRMDPRRGQMDEVEIPGLEGSGPMLLAWSEGAVWFTSREKAGIYGRYDPSTGDVRLWQAPTEGRVYGIAATPDGAVWVGRYNGSELLRADGGGDTVPTVDLRAPPGRTGRTGLGMRRIAASPGGWIWVSGYGRSRVTGVDPASGEELHIPLLASRARPYGITVDDLGRVWFSERGSNQLVVYDPRTDRRSAVTLPVPGGTVRHIAVDVGRGRVWLPLSDVGVIAVLELQ